MKKNILSNRSLKFLERNDLENESAREYVVSLLENFFLIKNYDFKQTNYGLGLFIKDYVLYIDKEYIELKVFYNNTLLKTFLGDSCWFQALKFIKQKEE